MLKLQPTEWRGLREEGGIVLPPSPPCWFDPPPPPPPPASSPPGWWKRGGERELMGGGGEDFNFYERFCLPQFHHIETLFRGMKHRKDCHTKDAMDEPPCSSPLFVPQRTGIFHINETLNFHEIPWVLCSRECSQQLINVININVNRFMVLVYSPICAL
jgi:hypothetical protein